MAGLICPIGPLVLLHNILHIHVKLTSIYMNYKQNPVCPVCISWMLEHPTNPGWLKCLSCGYCKEIMKRVITIPKGEKRNEY